MERLFPRKTKIKAIEEIDRSAIETKQIKIGYDLEAGFVGTKVSGPQQLSCTNFDKLLIFFKDGTYKVINIPDKQYIEEAVWVGIADKTTVINVIYKNTETKQAWAKRFIVEKFILDKTYRYFDENATLEYISSAVEPVIEIQFSNSKKQFQLKEVLVKGAQARGIRIAKQAFKSLKVPS